jgi:hypothetical protein
MACRAMAGAKWRQIAFLTALGEASNFELWERTAT